MYAKIKSTGKSSEHYGPCEVCGRYCSDVWISTVYKKYQHGERKGSALIRQFFGHVKCLLKRETTIIPMSLDYQNMAINQGNHYQVV